MQVAYSRRIAPMREEPTGRPAFSFRPRSDDLISAVLDAAFLITQQAVSAWLLKQCVLFAIGLRHAADKVHAEIEVLFCHKRSRQISEHCVHASKGVAARVRVEQMRWVGVSKQSGTSGGRDRLAGYIHTQGNPRSGHVRACITDHRADGQGDINHPESQHVRTQGTNRHAARAHATNLVLGPTASCQRGSGFGGQALQSHNQEQMSPTFADTDLRKTRKHRPLCAREQRMIHAGPYQTLPHSQFVFLSL